MSEILFAEDVEEALKIRRYTPQTSHPCGCVTRFDTLHWRSEAVTRCQFHAEQEAKS